MITPEIDLESAEDIHQNNGSISILEDGSCNRTGIVFKLNTVFQKIIYCFDSPAQMIQFPKVVNCIPAFQQIGDQYFRAAVIELETDDPQFDRTGRFYKLISQDAVIPCQTHIPGEFTAATHYIVQVLRSFLPEFLDQFAAGISAVKGYDTLVEKVSVSCPVSGNVSENQLPLV